MDSTHHLIHGIDYGVEGFVGLAVAPGHDVIVVCVQVQEVVQLFLVVRLIFRNSRMYYLPSFQRSTLKWRPSTELRRPP